MMAGSRDVGVSPSIVGSFSRKEAALVEVMASLESVNSVDFELESLDFGGSIVEFRYLCLLLFSSSWMNAFNCLWIG